MTLSKRVKLSKKGQFVIPNEMRQALGVKEGDEVILTLEGSQIIMMRPDHFARATRGSLKGTWGKTKEEITRYLERERNSWE